MEKEKNTKAIDKLGISLNNHFIPLSTGFFIVERLLASLNGIRICFLFLGKNILEQLLELQALESYYVFSIFLFSFLFFSF